MSEGQQWASIAEAGSMSAMRLMAAIHRVFGGRVASLVLYPITAYFFLGRPEARQASAEYLRTLRGWAGGEVRAAEPTSGDVFRHIHSFSVNLYERMVAWGGGSDDFVFEYEGDEELRRVVESGSGAIMLGAHVGSFDMARILAEQHGVVINVLMFTDHAERITSFFERLDPNSKVRVLRLDPTTAQTGLAIRACLERGELVAILADRVPPGSREEVASVEFLGRSARFPLSPYYLACTLGCPLLTSMCVRIAPNRYRASVEVLSRGERVSRAERRQRADQWLAQYVETLERYCREFPMQWFNFFHYWEQSDG